jgi:hypothetical protein
LPVGVWLAAGCSSNPRRGDDIDTNDTETSKDTETGTENDTGSETDSETATDEAGWSWLETPSDIVYGEFTDIEGRAADDVLATGSFLAYPWQPAMAYDGWSVDLFSPDSGSALEGTGVCVSESGVLYLGTTSHDLPRVPRFFSQQDNVWDEVVFDSDLCAGGSWFAPFGMGLSGRSITCLETAGFAALVSCYLPPQGPPPGETFIHLVINDGQDWTTPYSFSTTSDSFPIAALWGQAADDLFFFVAEPDAPGYHFDGVEMTPVTSPPGSWFFSGDGGVKAMAGTRASQGKELGYWVTGTYADEEADPWRYRGFVWRSPDGLAWTDVEVPHPADPSACNEYFHDLWISDQNEVFVVGACSYGDGSEEPLPLMLRFDGEVWEEIEVPQHPLLTGEARGDLQRIWGTGGVIFVAAIMNLAGHDTPVLLRYQPI